MWQKINTFSFTKDEYDKVKIASQQTFLKMRYKYSCTTSTIQSFKVVVRGLKNANQVLCV